jgi:hypothetical protein
MKAKTNILAAKTDLTVSYFDGFLLKYKIPKIIP